MLITMSRNLDEQNLDMMLRVSYVPSSGTFKAMNLRDGTVKELKEIEIGKDYHFFVRRGTIYYEKVEA